MADAQHLAANTTVPSDGPEVAGQSITGLVVGPIGGAVLLAIVVAILVVVEKHRHKNNPRRKSIAPPGYPDAEAEEGRYRARAQTMQQRASPGPQRPNTNNTASTDEDEAKKSQHHGRTS